MMFLRPVEAYWYAIERQSHPPSRNCFPAYEAAFAAPLIKCPMTFWFAPILENSKCICRLLMEPYSYLVTIQHSPLLIALSDALGAFLRFWL